MWCKGREERGRGESQKFKCNMYLNVGATEPLNLLRGATEFNSSQFGFIYIAPKQHNCLKVLYRAQRGPSAWSRTGREVEIEGAICMGQVEIEGAICMGQVER